MFTFGQAVEVAEGVVAVFPVDRALFVGLMSGLLAAEAAHGVVVATGGELALLALGFPALCVPLQQGEGLVIEADVRELVLWGVAIVNALAIGQDEAGSGAGPVCFITRAGFAGADNVWLVVFAGDEVGVVFGFKVAESVVFKFDELMRIVDV